MEILYLDGLPSTMGKGSIVRQLVETGNLHKKHIGKIELNGGLATVEITDGRAARLIPILDGHTIENRHIRAWVQAGGASDPHFSGCAAISPRKRLRSSKPTQRHRPIPPIPSLASLSAPKISGSAVASCCSSPRATNKPRFPTAAFPPALQFSS
jgi:hypothetical protein